MRVLVLGGTSEASRLAELLAGESEIAATLSFAGRTAAPLAPPIPYRVGGFGGAEGLAHYLAAQQIGLVVDATHPFADAISRNAVTAAAQTGVPLLRLSRPPWREAPGDRWLHAVSMEAAAAALGPEPQRVFLTIGRLQLAAFVAAPQHFYLIRVVDPLASPPGLPRHRAIIGRGPFSLAGEEALLRAEAIDVIVSKNSGGEATKAKLAAARGLGLRVIMVDRPQADSAETLHDPAEALAFILRLRGKPAPRAHGEKTASRGV